MAALPCAPKQCGHGFLGTQKRGVGGQDPPDGSFTGSPSAWGEPATRWNKGRVLVTKLTFMNTAGIRITSADPHKMPVGQKQGTRTCAHMQDTPGGTGTFQHLLLNNSNHVLFNPTSGRPPTHCSWHPHTGISGFSPAVCIHPSLYLINKFVKCWLCRDFSIFLWNETVTWKGELICCTNVWDKKDADCRMGKQ